MRYDVDTTVGTTDGVMRANFDAPQWAPTPGQYLVLYDGDTCLGGAVIVDRGGSVSGSRVEAAVAT